MALTKDEWDVLNGIRSGLGELRDAVTSLESRLSERCPNHAVRIERLETILDGSASNGQNPGLIARMGLVESALERINKARARLYAVAGAAIGGLLVAMVEKFL